MFSFLRIKAHKKQLQSPFGVVRRSEIYIQAFQSSHPEEQNIVLKVMPDLSAI